MGGKAKGPNTLILERLSQPIPPRPHGREALIALSITPKKHSAWGAFFRSLAPLLPCSLYFG
jgi:hypothetical protein